MSFFVRIAAIQPDASDVEMVLLCAVGFGKAHHGNMEHAVKNGIALARKEEAVSYCSDRLREHTTELTSQIVREG